MAGKNIEAKPRQLHGGAGSDFEDVEHLVSDEDPDTALCGIDQTGVGWNLGWPVCRACVAVSEGRMS